MRRRGISKIYLYPAIFIVAVFALAGLRIVAVNWQAEKPPTTTTAPTTVPVTQPATAPATTQVVEKKPPVDLLDVLRADDPDYPTTQPLDLPSDLIDAARIVLDRPVYMDGFGNLWITHPQGQAIEDVLKKPIKKRTIVVNEEVLHVHWPLTGGTVAPMVFSRPSGEKAWRVHQAKRADEARIVLSEPIGRIETVGNRIYHASKEGVSLLFDADPKATQKAMSPLVKNTGENPMIALSTGTGLICWSPWELGKRGSAGAVYIDDKGEQRTLDRSTGWTDQPIHLVPLADGSVLAIGRSESGVELILKPLTEAAPPSPQRLEKVRQLARKLADPDPLIREATQRELEAEGPAIYPELELLMERLPAEAQVRIEAILGQRFAPTIAGLRPLDGQPLTAARFRDGGCVLMLTGGGMLDDNGQEKSIIPAWISIRPGKYLERIDPSTVSNFVAGKHKLGAFGSEWVMVDPNEGAQRWIGTKLYPLAGPEYKEFDDFVGIDAQRRWLFRATKQPGKTLILDTSLPDLTPKLPVWVLDAPDGSGWTNKGWPAVKRHGKVFVLGERGWRMPEEGEAYETDPPKVLATTAINPAGDRFDVINYTITITPKKGDRQTFRMTDDIHHGATPQIFWAGDRLFLSSGAGKLHRFAWREGKLKFEETFEENLPQNDPLRLWIDPAGRLIYAGDNTLWITFPEGRIPPQISQLILQGR